MNTFIQQGCIKLIKSDSDSLSLSRFSKNQEKIHEKHKISILEWFLKDHVTLKTGAYIWKYIKTFNLNCKISQYYSIFNQINAALVNAQDTSFKMLQNLTDANSL